MQLTAQVQSAVVEHSADFIGFRRSLSLPPLLSLSLSLSLSSLCLSLSCPPMFFLFLRLYPFPFSFSLTILFQPFFQFSLSFSLTLSPSLSHTHSLYLFRLLYLLREYYLYPSLISLILFPPVLRCVVLYQTLSLPPHPSSPPPPPKPLYHILYHFSVRSSSCSFSYCLHVKTPHSLR